MNSSLRKAQAKVAAARAAVAKDDAALHAIQDEIVALNVKIEALRKRQAAKHLHEALAAAERELAGAEEIALKNLAIDLAGEIMKKQSADPVRHHLWVVAQITRLRTMVRGELDTPLDQKYSQHPVITQALALLPPLDPMDSPVYELGYYTVAGQTDWPSRRRALLAAAEKQAA